MWFAKYFVKGTVKREYGGATSEKTIFHKYWRRLDADLSYELEKFMILNNNYLDGERIEAKLRITLENKWGGQLIETWETDHTFRREAAE